MAGSQVEGTSPKAFQFVYSIKERKNSKTEKSINETMHHAAAESNMQFTLLFKTQIYCDFIKKADTVRNR